MTPGLVRESSNVRAWRCPGSWSGGCGGADGVPDERGMQEMSNLTYAVAWYLGWALKTVQDSVLMLRAAMAGGGGVRAGEERVSSRTAA